jgi:hypothetical protein
MALPSQEAARERLPLFLTRLRGMSSDLQLQAKLGERGLEASIQNSVLVDTFRRGQTTEARAVQTRKWAPPGSGQLTDSG